jgi:sporulation protein YlmC with PRC-barrel domain
MRPAQDLIDKPLISIDEGRFLGNVRDIYVDRDLTRITAIHVGREGLLKRKDRYISRDHVVVFGADAILVKSSDVVETGRDDEKSAAWMRLNDLQGREIVTRGGTRVAQVGDVLIDEQADIAALSLARTFVEGPIAEKGQIGRPAFLPVGDAEQPLVVDLTAAEQGRPTDAEE